MTREEILLEIARYELGFEALETRHSGADFKELPVWSVRRALELAYDHVQESVVPYADADDSASSRPPSAAEPPMSHQPTFEPELVNVAHHRNGLDGAPFNVVLFNDAGRCPGRKLGIVFEAKHHVAVFELAKLAAGDIVFGSNSWRGDQYEDRLRAMIVAWSQGANGEDE